MVLLRRLFAFKPLNSQSRKMYEIFMISVDERGTLLCLYIYITSADPGFCQDGAKNCRYSEAELCDWSEGSVSHKN